MIPLVLFFFAANHNAAALTRAVAESGRVLEIGVTPSERATPPPLVAPGAPPLVRFRYFEGQMRHRFGNLDLVMDDAGH
ncbi:MAG TPA: hypothetical protein VMU80_05180 [Bryobacteraceae bacterium]|nr:hypothetical protein [Bryobacteraceae bacterium]